LDRQTPRQDTWLPSAKRHATVLRSFWARYVYMRRNQSPHTHTILSINPPTRRRLVLHMFIVPTPFGSPALCDISPLHRNPVLLPIARIFRPMNLRRSFHLRYSVPGPERCSRRDRRTVRHQQALRHAPKFRSSCSLRRCRYYFGRLAQGYPGEWACFAMRHWIPW
jgi:hypothetical protein